MATANEKPRQPILVVVGGVAVALALVAGLSVVLPTAAAVSESIYSTLKNDDAACISSWDRVLEPQWANGKCSILQEDQRVPVDHVSSYYGVKPAHKRYD